MNSNRIVHLVCMDKFIPAYFQFIQNNFNSENHLVVLFRSRKGFGITGFNVINFDGVSNILSNSRTVIAHLRHADKVIVHGLISPRIVVYLFLHRAILPRCYWLIWGNDLYGETERRNRWKVFLLNKFRRPVAQRIGHLVTYIDGDVELARRLYAATGEYHTCLMYPSNVWEPRRHCSPVAKGATTVQVGNSADPSNRHIEAFRLVAPKLSRTAQVLVPLSYGYRPPTLPWTRSYVDSVCEEGFHLFGNRFRSVRHFLSKDAYSNLLSTVDILVFNHRRQQGMGTLISALAMGKTVYMRTDTTSWTFLMQLGIKVRDIRRFTADPLPDPEGEQNMRITRRYFSLDTLLRQWHSLLES